MGRILQADVVPEEAERLIELHEARRNKPYRCSEGYLTLGVGHNLDAKPISNQAIDVIYADDLHDAVQDLDRIAPWWRAQDPVRRAALLDLSFNLGGVRLAKFVNALGAWRNGVHEAAAVGLEQSKWFGQVGGRAKRIVAMVRTGDWPREIA